MGSKGRFKYAKQWEQFAKVLKSGIRPTTFEAAWPYVSDKVSGMYESEAKAIWNFLASRPIKSIVEVGRNLGGTLWLMGCASKELKEVLSIDIEWYNTTDDVFPDWFALHNIHSDLRAEDSTTFKASGMYDFAFIDGLHTGPGVKADLEIWKDRCHYIGFHDYANRKTNKHKRCFQDVVDEITKAKDKYGWKQIGERGRSEIIFETGVE